MIIESRTVTHDNLVNHTHFLKALFLKGIHIESFRTCQLMEIHVKDGSGKEFGGYKTLVKRSGIIDFLDEFIGNNFARLIMERIGLEHFRFIGIVLHKLAWQFHKITRGVGAAQTLIMCLGQQSMQRMAKLMEECRHLAETE